MMLKSDVSTLRSPLAALTPRVVLSSIWVLRLFMPAPVPMRGRRNEPAFLPHVLAKLAEVRGWNLDEAEARTEGAFFDLFDRIPRP